MTKKAYGKIDLDTLNDLGGIDFSYTASGGTRSKLYYCDAGHVDSLIASVPTVCPEQPLCNCIQSINAKSMGSKGLIEVRVTWSSQYFDSTYYPEDIVEKQMSREVKFMPITDKTLVSSGMYTANALLRLKRQGWKVVPLASVRYTYSIYKNNYSWSESNFTNLIGSVGAPPEIIGATSAKWFRESTEATKSGADQTRITEVWVYSDAGWNVAP